MRRILFGTFHLAGYRHLLELAHMHEHPRHLGIVSATLTAHDADGALVKETALDATQPVIAIDPLLPVGHEQLLIGIDVAYTIDRCELIYGYLDLPGSESSGVYYPINFTKGLRDRRSYLNTGNFSFGPMPHSVRPVLFLGNFADYGDAAGRLTAHYGPETRREDVRLGPKRSRFVDIEPSCGGHPLGFIEFVSTARLATYMIGRARDGGFTFFEHLMPLTR